MLVPAGRFGAIRGRAGIGRSGYRRGADSEAADGNGGEEANSRDDILLFENG